MNPAIASEVTSGISSAPRSWPKSFKKHGSSSKNGCGKRAMPCWPRCNDAGLQAMKQGMTHMITSDRLDLTDLLEKLAVAGLCFSDLLLPSQTIRIRVADQSMSPTLWKG